MKIVRAKRQKIKVPILLMGASGSGKTLSALLISKGLVESMFPDASDESQWQKIGMIDTEHKRSNLYVNTTHDNTRIGEFTKVDLIPPFSTSNYAQAFKMLKEAGCEVIIIDSLSSAWSGDGGILDKVNKLGGAIGDWKKVSPDQKQLLSLLTDQDVHVVATVRSKQGVEVTKNDVGKVRVEKVGLKPDTKDGLEYEFAITFQIYSNHIAQAMKDNSSMFDQSLVLNRKVGNQIYDWAEKGLDVKAEYEARRQKGIAYLTKESGENKEIQALLTEFKQKINQNDLQQWTLDQLILASQHIKQKIRQTTEVEK